MKKVYVGNLSFQTSEQELEAAFAAYGTVTSVAIVRDRDTGKSRGFGFVEMDDDQAAAAAISALNGSQMSGRALTVNEAQPKAPRRDFGGGGEGRGRMGGAGRGHQGGPSY